MAGPAEEFDLEATLRSLEGLSQKALPQEQGTLRLAADALLFLHAQNLLQAFRDYLERARMPAVLAHRIAHEFADMEQALEWLAGQPPPSHGTLVRVAGRTHAVWRQEDASLRLLPSVSPQELAERNPWEG